MGEAPPEANVKRPAERCPGSGDPDRQCSARCRPDPTPCFRRREGRPGGKCHTRLTVGNEGVKAEDKAEETVAPVNLSVVLDRSGSMQQIASDMIGGFEAFIEEQRRAEGDVRLRLVQFDSEDPFEVLIDGEDLTTATLDARNHVPRGLTPLLDAVGRMIARIDADIAERGELGKPAEDQVVLVITDGLENASNHRERGVGRRRHARHRRPARGHRRRADDGDAVAVDR